jgi:hypothetical protein
MPISFKTLADPQYLSTSAGVLVTNTSGIKTYVKTIILFNNHTSAITVDIHKVPNSGGSVGTASNANKIFSFSLQPSETKLFEFGGQGLMLTSTNDTIQGKASTASQVVICIEGGTE